MDAQDPFNSHPAKVTLHSPGQISYWAAVLKATPAQLHDALKVAGPDVSKVRMYLAHKEWRAARA